MEWLIKLSKPVDLIGILQITPGLFQVLLAGALSIGGRRERLFLSIFKGRQGLRQPRLGGGEVGGSQWAAGPVFSLL